MAERILTFSGTGYLRNWIEPEGLKDNIGKALTQLGYGVEAVGISSNLYSATSAIPLLIPTNAYTYNIVVKIQSFAGDSAERVRNAVVAVLNYQFSDVRMSLTNDVNNVWDQSGNLQVQSNNNPSAQPPLSGLDQTLNSLKGAAGISDTEAAGTIFGLSFGTAAIIGIAAVYLLSRQSAPAVAYRRYYR
jgi:hypothetical protein